MSNRLRYDPLLVRYLAAELDERLRGRGCASTPFFGRDLSVTLPLSGGEELRADLHPSRGWIRILPSDEEDPEELDAVCTGVSAPVDERILRIHLDSSGRFRESTRTIVIELPTNQWNAIVVEGERQIVNVLRGRRAGARSLFPGGSYAPPPAAMRFGAETVDERAARERWLEVMGDDGENPAGRLISNFAWTGTANAAWILGGGSGSGGASSALGLESASGDHPGSLARFRRWWWLRGMPEPRPCTLHLPEGPLPYPFPLEGLVADPAPSLLGALARLADREPGPQEERERGTAAAEALLRRRLARAERKLERLWEELERAGEADRLRGLGDLLLAHLHLVPKGVSVVRLDGWDGVEVEITLDPALTAAENAGRLYEEARRKQRAEERVPALIAETEAFMGRLHAALASVAEGKVPAWVSELLVRQAERRDGDATSGASLPYRVFRTSGGLEVRVGRGAKENDRLTFKIASPNDVWLHAQSVPGSHVILRWPDPVGAPPARDLIEAAQLAAVFSRARTSSTVAVDWTRRKYVRKPRGAAPGLVIPQRVKTLFVAPDEAVVGRLAEESG